MPKTLRLAVAQTTMHEDPRDAALLRASGEEIRRLMREARAAGARLVHFTEGATCFPSKYVMSEDGPDEVGNADWSRFSWDVLRQELARISALAGELRLWTVLGSVHRLTPPHRPHNSQYVISDRGKVATRYDERTLSHTKITYMYTPGTAPVTFELDGFRFGCALGMDVHFPAMLDLDVDCVLFSTTGGVPKKSVATEAQGHAAVNHYWLSFAVPTQQNPDLCSGITGPDGSWLAQCPADGTPSLVTADLDRAELSEVARTWRRETGLALADRPATHPDTRSTTRTGF